MQRHKSIKKSTRFHDYIKRLKPDSLELALTLVACGGLILGWGHIGHNIHHNLRIQSDNQINRALADGAIIHPSVSRREKHDFANRLVQIDNSLPKSERVTPSLLVGQAALESSWGQSPLYKNANNPFGVKGSYNGDYLVYSTDEYNDKGQEYTELADWKQYPSLTVAVRDHNKLLHLQFLAGSQPNDYISEAKALQRNHYATDPYYAQKLMACIQDNNLSRFD